MEEFVSVKSKSSTRPTVTKVGDKSKRKPESIKVEFKQKEKEINNKYPFAEDEVEESKGFLNDFLDYLTSHRFNDKCEEVAKDRNVRVEDVSKGFVKKTLGKIGTTLNIVIDIVDSGLVILINILKKILTSTSSIICNVARALVNFLSGSRKRKEVVA